MLMLLVVAHELGHFIMARRNGVEVEEFGIGFPPRAIAWRKVNGKWKRIPKQDWEKTKGKGVVISLNWLPIGGFCQMKGESAADTRKGTFGKARFLKKTKILFGGVVMNWIVAAVILSCLAFVGMPHFIDNQFMIESDTQVVATEPVSVVEIIAGSPAAIAGLREGDVISRARAFECEGGCERSEMEGVDIATTQDLLDFLARHKGENVIFAVERNGESIVNEVSLAEEGDYTLGAQISGSQLYVSGWSAPIVGVVTTAQLTGETFKGVGQLIMNLFSGVFEVFNPNAEVKEDGAEKLAEARDSVSGPVGIVGMIFPAFAESGGHYLFFLVAVISISLACMNVLPIPALDGGRWLLILIYKLRDKKLTKEAEEKIVSRSFMVLLGLAAIVTVIDIVRRIMRQYERS